MGKNVLEARQLPVVQRPATVACRLSRLLRESLCFLSGVIRVVTLLVRMAPFSILT